jgi:hypothetical protein
MAMGDVWISDISDFDLPDGSLPAGQGGRMARFLGEIVSAASLLAPGEFQVSAVGCRRRPKRRRCPGLIRLGRDQNTDEIHWACTTCTDRGVITNWQASRWDLSPELKKGRIISLSEERARRAGRLTAAAPLKIFELDVELIYAPVVLDERVYRRVRLSGDNTLHELHTVFHLAFDRAEEEAYEFMFGPPYDPETRRFTGSSTSPDGEDPSCETKAIRLDSLGLRPGDNFGYLFDFSDEWVHRVTVRSVKELMSHSVPPQVVSRLGDSPPQLPPVEEPWDDDLFWDDVETTYPLTGLYGPYDAAEGVDPEDWLALDDLERHLLVMEAHTHSLPPGHPAVESMLLHAVIHVLAESHLASTGRRKAKAALAPYLEEDASRHRAIHRLGEHLVRQQLSPEQPRRRPGTKRPRRRRSS